MRNSVGAVQYCCVSPVDRATVKYNCFPLNYNNTHALYLWPNSHYSRDPCELECLRGLRTPGQREAHKDQSLFQALLFEHLFIYCSVLLSKRCTSCMFLQIMSH